MDNTRTKILNILVQFDRNSTYPNLALKSELRDIQNEQDKGFISAVVYGVIENKLLLDYYIGSVSSVKLKKINTVVLNILRMGIYQIMFMSVPASAACNTSVELAKNNGQSRSSGFVNAILRKLARIHDEIELPPENTDSYISVKYSISLDNLQVIIDSLGKYGTITYLNNISKKSNDIYIAVNTTKITDNELICVLEKENVKACLTDVGGLLRCKPYDIEKSAAFGKGLFHVVGFPSYIAAKSLDLHAHHNVYDMCAAPGGKTFKIAYDSQDEANIIAFDVHKHKIDSINLQCKRLGIKSVSPIVSDSSIRRDDLVGTADRVLCDVPCSGLGMINKKADIKYKRINYTELTNLQYKILENGAQYLKPGGKLVYSTCTVNCDENRRLVDRFLEKNSSYSLSQSEIYKGKCGDILFLPEEDYCDGFYIAVIEKAK